MCKHLLVDLQSVKPIMSLRAKSLGRSGLELSVRGFSGTALGNMYRAISGREALDTLGAAYAAGIRYFDTAPL